ncbi:hypothetical protein D3OALGA1CA_2686 [Olavius algarvensis associated proteobacterium Delta 3]|nr:hypothetical protein D3OALGB2SA_2644 [Olavius algarvensis associated proteobacterium Delta 3]CAB5122802.1 hypothetical protein D3OALGA1CA_2686 [Olavius algarvensis associated proteobacterium Delta 3]
MHPIIPAFLLIQGLSLIVAQICEAYIGPGAGITAIGTVIAFIGAICLGIIAFVWYPIKRLLAKIRKKDEAKLDDPT